MSATLTGIFRHPIKSLGREGLETAALTPGARLPGDRLWGVTHEHSKLVEDEGWAHCKNFLQCARGPGLMAVTAQYDEAAGTVRLDHPEAGALLLTPEDPSDVPRLLDWLGRVWSADLPAPTGLYSYEGGLTDKRNPWVSINNHASHRAVEGRADRALSIHRWRGNLWLDGLGPWQEFEWIGREIQIGAARLRVSERIERCTATFANPDSGQRDIDMFEVLGHWDHQDFGVFAEVVEGGEIHVGDPVTVP